jgi:uncharacterized protein with ATP-grasp and redox domains
MKTYLDCIPCLFKQALFTAGAAVKDGKKAISFFLKVKRPVIAQHLGVRIGSMIPGGGRLQAHRPFENQREE